MTDTEIETLLELNEERIGRLIDKVENRLENASSEFKHYQESHLREHDHNKESTSLKLELSNEKIIRLQEIFERFEHTEETNESKKIGTKQIAWAKWGLVITISLFFLSSFFGINYQSIKEYLSNQNAQTVEQKSKKDEK